MTTLFDILKSKVWSPVIAESTVFNPIGCKIDSVIMVNDINVRDSMFRVKAIHEHSALNMAFTDYDLLPMGVTKPEHAGYVLRVMPSSGPYGCVMCLMLHNAYSGGFSQEIIDLAKKVSAEDGVFCVGEEEFWRIDSQKESIVANVKSIADTNGDGSIDPSEIVASEIEYWDFSRMTPVDGESTEEYLAIELDTDTGWINMLRGFGVDLRKIESY